MRKSMGEISGDLMGGAIGHARWPRAIAARPGRGWSTGEAAPLLELRGVVHHWRAGAGSCTATVRALRGVDLAVRAGEVLALTGLSGAGKTTLMLCAAGIARADEGTVAGDAAGRAVYVGAGGPLRASRHASWMRRALAAIDRGARVLLLDVLDPPELASPRAVAAFAGGAASLGLAVVVAARDSAALPAFASRVVTLAAGRVVSAVDPLALVRAGRSSRASSERGASHGRAPSANGAPSAASHASRTG